MNTVRTIEEFSTLFHSELKDHYPKEEIDALLFISVNDLLGITKDEMRTGSTEPIKSEIAEKLDSAIKELKSHKPLQYILGSTEFYKCKIRVNEHVLIPRPETEELVEFILKETKSSDQLNILDIGTGSGCIAIALKKNLPKANISAIDISEEALLVAKANAILNQTKINFLQADILSPLPILPPTGEGERVGATFNIIVSNPPYVLASEKEKMNKNVLDYEPHLALFVNDDDPLLFYKAIADFAKNHLIPCPSPKGEGGKLYFEINEALGNDVKKLLQERGFNDVEVKKDLNGKDRIVIAKR